ncbi:hypothetical protein BH23BAC1_BH23BAC1_40780 [soil metagenome]
MDLFYDPHREILKKLLENKIEFIMVGGYAVNYYGFNRPTGDLDLWLKPTEENKNKFILLLEKMAFEKEGIKYIKSLNFSEAEVFCIGEVPVRVDFLTQLSGVKYEEADKEKMVAEVEDMKIPVIHLDHLILTKLSNKRTKDKLDVEELQKVQQKKNRQ